VPALPVRMYRTPLIDHTFALCLVFPHATESTCLGEPGAEFKCLSGIGLGHRLVRLPSGLRHGEQVWQGLTPVMPDPRNAPLGWTGVEVIELRQGSTTCDVLVGWEYSFPPTSSG
jgi:hypothetical protein